MEKELSRRDFLKLGGLALGGLAFRGLASELTPNRGEAIGLARVTIQEIKIYSEPSYQSEEVGLRKRDQLLYLYEKITSPLGPEFNPRWYRVEGGYAHTAYLQPVETTLHAPVTNIPAEGQLFEVSVPLTQTLRYTKTYGWQPLYRLYYQSMHWVTGVDIGPDGQLWYRITDDLLLLDYHVQAKHMRLVEPEEYSPVSTDVPLGEKRVEVSIDEQTLTAYQHGEVVLYTQISTGIPGLAPNSPTPTATPRGSHFVRSKVPVRHMGNGQLTNDISAYELPGVPWCSYFTDTGVAFHGTYWHDNYGNEMSHGCVNMRPEEAKWLFRWLAPVSEPLEWEQNGRGTNVYVF